MHNSPADSGRQGRSEDCTAKEKVGKDKHLDSTNALQQNDQQLSRMIAFMETWELPDY